MKQTDLKDQQIISIPKSISNLLIAIDDLNLEDFLLEYNGMNPPKIDILIKDNQLIKKCESSSYENSKQPITKKDQQIDQDQFTNLPYHEFPQINQFKEITLFKRNKKKFQNNQEQLIDQEQENTLTSQNDNSFDFISNQKLIMNSIQTSEINQLIKNNHDQSLDKSQEIQIKQNNISIPISQTENEIQSNQDNPQQYQENQLQEFGLSKRDKDNKNIEAQENEDVKEIFNNNQIELQINNLNDSSNYQLGQLMNFGVQSQPQQLHSIEITSSKNNQKTNENPSSFSFQDIKLELQKKQMIINSYLREGGEATIFDGYFLNEKGQVQICVFRICMESEKQINEEIEIVKNIKFPMNIVKHYQQFCLDIKGTKVGVFVQERCKCSLADEIKEKRQNKYTIDQFWKIVLNSLDGLVELRSYRIIHQDIKPGNILINSEDQYVICDFGIASKAYDGQSNVKGYSAYYCPPEQKSYNIIDFSADLYGLGNTFIQVLNETDDEVGKDTIKKIIEDYMLKESVKDRIDCLKIIQLFYEEAKQKVSQKFLIDNKQKINQIIELDKFNNMKDLKYQQCIKLTYLFLNLQITLDINNLGDQFSQLISSPKENRKNPLNRELIENLSSEQLFFIINQIGIEFQNIGLSEQSLKFLKLLVYIIQLDEQANENFLFLAFNSIGLYYSGIGDYKRSLDFYLESLYVVKSSLYLDFTSISSSLNNVGIQYFKLGYSKEALSYFQESQDLGNLGDQTEKINRRNLGLNLNNIGNYYQYIGDQYQALDYLEKSLKIQQSISDKIHPDIALSINNIGICYQFFGDFTKALEYYVQSLDMYESLFKGSHPMKATILTNIGTCYEQLGDYKKALNFQNTSLEMRKKIFGEDNIEISDSLNNMGNCYLSSDQFENALRCYEQALIIRKKYLTRNHYLIANSLNNIGYYYQQIKENKEALNYFEQSLNMRREIYPEYHPDIADSLNNIGASYLSLKQFKLSLKNYRESLMIRKKIFPGGNHYSVCQSFNNIGNLYLDFGKYEKAQKYLEESFRISQNIQLGKSPFLVKILYNLGSCYYSMNRLDLSFDYYLKSLALSRQILKENNILILNILFALGTNYEKQGNIEQAFTYYEELLRILRQLYPLNDPQIINLQKRIQSLYQN